MTPILIHVELNLSENAYLVTLVVKWQGVLFKLQFPPIKIHSNTR